MTEERLRTLKYPNDVVDDVTKLVYLHLRIHTYAMGWTDKAVRRYVRDAGPLLDELNHLQRCDCTTRNQNRARARWHDGWTSSKRASPSCASRRSSTRSGRRSTAGRSWTFLGVEPGRVVGEALDFLLEARLDEGPIDEAEAYARLADWARERGIPVPRRNESCCQRWLRHRQAEQAAGVAAQDRGLVVVGERRLDDLREQVADAPADRMRVEVGAEHDARRRRTATRSPR